jgi:cytochrome c6
MKTQGLKCCLLLLMFGWLFIGSVAWADTTSLDTAKLFEVHCAGCHPQGGNIIRRGKTLKLKALQSNHVDTTDAIAQLIADGKGNMTAFGDRLASTEIQTLSEYVLTQAATNWKG